MTKSAFGRWSNSKSDKAGFTLIELLIVIAIIALLIGILLPALGEARRYAKMLVCQTGERSFATATATYANDKKEKLATMDWKAGDPKPTDLKGWESNTGYYGSDLEAASAQAVYIIRKRTGASNEKAPIVENWIPFVLYSHIALTDWIGGQLPSPAAACPEDLWRVTMQRNWKDPAATGLPYPAAGENGTSNWRWPFSTSYVFNQSHWGPSRQTQRTLSNGLPTKTAIYYPDPTAGGNIYTADGNASLGGQFGINKLGDVRFPSQKTIMSDDFARHFGRKAIHYSAIEAKQPLVFYDGSVRVYQTGQTCPGWDPQSAASRSTMDQHFSYKKAQAEYDPVLYPVTNPGNGTAANPATYQVPAGWYKFTRGGLYGWDVPRGPGPAGLAKITGGKMTGEENELNTKDGKW